MSSDTSNPILRRLGVAGVGDKGHFNGGRFGKSPGEVEDDALRLLAKVFIGETDVLFTTIDTSGDGEIEESEFFAAVYKLCPHLMPDHWLEEDKKTTAVKFVRQVTSGRAKNTQEDENFL